MKKNKLLEHQFGFGKNYSITYLTLEMFDKLFDSKHNGNTPATIFLEIKKAFDELKCYGVDCTVILW